MNQYIIILWLCNKYTKLIDRVLVNFLGTNQRVDGHVLVETLWKTAKIHKNYSNILINWYIILNIIYNIIRCMKTIYGIKKSIKIGVR